MFLSPLQACLLMMICEDEALNQMSTTQIERSQLVVNCLCTNGPVVSPMVYPADSRQVLSVKIPILTYCCNPWSATVWMIIHAVCGIVPYLQPLSGLDTTVQVISNNPWTLISMETSNGLLPLISSQSRYACCI